MDKSALRKQLLEERERIGEVRAREKSLLICSLLIERFQPAVCCSFVAFRNEVDLMSYHEWLLKEDLVLLLPRVEGKTMIFYRVVDLQVLEKSSWGIWEPPAIEENKWSYETIWNSNPLVLTPALGFTVEGARLGYGGGFYDRFFSASDSRGQKIGICFKEQIVPEIPTETHDFFVDDVVCDL